MKETFIVWAWELLKIVEKKTGTPICQIRLNTEIAKKWHESGMTPEQAFRESGLES